MLNPEDLDFIRDRAAELASEDRRRLNELREQVRRLRVSVRPIHPRTTTTVSLVATDAGEDVIAFNPHLFFPVRVVDSWGRVILRDLLTPWMDIEALNRRHLENGDPKTPLGRLMADLGVSALWELSSTIPSPKTPVDRRHRRWLQDYRDLGEWAALYDYIVRSQFPTDTLIVRDGFLRSKIFRGDLFARMWDRIRQAIKKHWRETTRQVFVVGIAKQSKVLDRYYLAMLLEGIMVQHGACYVPVPPEMERQVYRWAEYAPAEEGEEEGESRKFVAGRLHLVKFGDRPSDPVFAVDVWDGHSSHEVDKILGYLLGNAREGFPRPFYPLCLQQAHEQARLSRMDAALLQDLVLEALREQIDPDRRGMIEALRLSRATEEGRHVREQA